MMTVPVSQAAQAYVRPSWACPGRCNDRHDRAARIYRALLARYDAVLAGLPDGARVPDPPEQPKHDPWPGDPVWCGDCRSEITASLASFGNLIPRLAAIPEEMRPPPDPDHERVRVRTSRISRAPSGHGDDLDDFMRWCLAWEDAYRDLMDWDPAPPRGTEATVTEDSNAFLRRHLNGILHGPFAREFGEETLGWRRELIHKTHSDSFPRHVRKPCPPPPRGCGRMTLWERPGEQYVTCCNPDCRRQLLRAEIGIGGE